MSKVIVKKIRKYVAFMKSWFIHLKLSYWVKHSKNNQKKDLCRVMREVNASVYNEAKPGFLPAMKTDNRFKA